ncbi:MAG TPA: hypothetical protein VIL95_06455 [Bacillota bacterium]
MPDVEVTRRGRGAVEFFVGEVRYVVTSADPDNYHVQVIFPANRPDRNFRVDLSYRLARGAQATGTGPGAVLRVLDVQVDPPHGHPAVHSYTDAVGSDAASDGP